MKKRIFRRVKYVFGFFLITFLFKRENLPPLLIEVNGRLVPAPPEYGPTYYAPPGGLGGYAGGLAMPNPYSNSTYNQPIYGPPQYSPYSQPQYGHSQYGQTQPPNSHPAYAQPHAQPHFSHSQQGK